MKVSRHRKSAWEILQEELIDKAYVKLNHDGIEEMDEGTIGLIVAILLSAGKDNDIEFLYSDPFKTYCNILKFDPQVIKKLILSTIDNKAAVYEFYKISRQELTEIDEFDKQV